MEQQQHPKHRLEKRTLNGGEEPAVQIGSSREGRVLDAGFAHVVSRSGRPRSLQNVIVHQPLKGQYAIVHVLTRARVLKGTLTGGTTLGSANGKIVATKSIRESLGGRCRLRDGSAGLFGSVEVGRVLAELVIVVGNTVALPNNPHGNFRYVQTAAAIATARSHEPAVIALCHVVVHFLGGIEELNQCKIEGHLLAIRNAGVRRFDPDFEILGPLKAPRIGSRHGNHGEFTKGQSIFPTRGTQVTVTLDQRYRPVVTVAGNSRNVKGVFAGAAIASDADPGGPQGRDVIRKSEWGERNVGIGGIHNLARKGTALLGLIFNGDQSVNKQRG